MGTGWIDLRKAPSSSNVAAMSNVAATLAASSGVCTISGLLTPFAPSSENIQAITRSE